MVRNSVPGRGDSKCRGSGCVQETQRLMCWEVANKGKFGPCDGGESILFVFFKITVATV